MTFRAGVPRSRTFLGRRPRSAIGADAAGLATLRAEPTALAVGRPHVSAGRLRFSTTFTPPPTSRFRHTVFKPFVLPGIFTAAHTRLMTAQQQIRRAPEIV